MALTDDFQDLLTAHGVDLLRYAAHVRRRILGILMTLRDELVAEIARLGELDTMSSRAQRRRLEALLKQAENSIRTAYREMRDEHAVEMLALSRTEPRAVAALLNSAIRVDLITPVIAPNVLRTVAKDTLVFGAPARDWWARQATDIKERFADAMRQGFLQQETVQELVQRVRGTATGRRNKYEWNGEEKWFVEFSGGIIDTSTRHAEAMVRTSVQSIANASRLELYKENDDVIMGLQASATLDERTTMLCMARDGHTWELDGTPIRGTKEPFPGHPPWHWNCRSTLLPITFTYEELATKRKATAKQRRLARKLDNAKVPALRSSMDGQVAAALDYEQWLKTKPEAFQLEKLGPARFNQWKKGKLTFAQMVDQKGNPMTLAQIARKHGITF